MRLNLLGLLLILFCGSLFAQFELIDAFPNLSGFTSPIDLRNSGDSTDRIFVVEQAGIIKVFENNPTITGNDVKIFLDITDRVASGGEMGLLGLAFHPDYNNNGYFYVNYTANNPRRTIISRFRVSITNPDSADKNSEFELLNFIQPYSNHNGGWVGFGPNDGYLYIASGDGGSSGDPQNYAQRINTLLGKILRIDVDDQDPGLNYSIPPTNPFFDSSGTVRREIFAWGLRNPWRCSFDPVTGWLWAGDVGQDEKEEIDIIESGKNYGWRCYEGNQPYNTNGCLDSANYEFPIAEYSHSEGYSVTGGYVYRGPNQPELFGKYIYADYGSDKIWSLEYDGINPPSNELIATATGSPTSFGVDESGELYICTFGGGRIYKFIPFSQTTFQLSVYIMNSWNMVSVPGINTNGMGVNIWWAFRDMTANVFRFIGGSYDPVTITDPGEGYWMKHLGARTYNTGDEWPAGGILIVPHDPINCIGGWNLFGVYENPVDTADLIGIIPPVYGYFGSYQIVDTLFPGYGYFVKCSGQIIIPDALSKGSNIIVEEYFKQDWGRITVTDALDKSFTLYAVNDEVDLSFYEMPPMPPAGSFDIRYSSGRIAEDISSSNQTIEMNAVEYPVTVSVENIVIVLMDASGKEINSELKPGDEVVISDNSINKLQVHSGEFILPVEYFLEQNYPNPFNPTTTIKYSIPEAANVQLTIFNTLGQKVTELVNTKLEAGKFSYQLDASNFPSGIYFVRMNAESLVSDTFYSHTIKIVLLK